jgi:hypothetical protein
MERRAAYARRAEMAPNHSRPDGVKFEHKWKAVVASEGECSNGSPKFPRLLSFRPKEDMLHDAFSAVRVQSELDLIADRYEDQELVQTIAPIAKEAAQAIISRCISKRIASTDDEIKSKRMISNWENGWGSGPLETIFESALSILALQQGSSQMLKFYLNAASVNDLSLDQFKQFCGTANAEDPISCTQCVYIHAWQLPKAGDVARRFDEVKLNDGSKPAHNLRDRVRLIPEGNSLTMAYVGQTHVTVAERYNIDEYRSNLLMRELWDENAPTTLIAFELPQESRGGEGAGQVLDVMEFLVAELLGTFGRGGFNQQPGGPYTFTQSNWLLHDECSEEVRRLGLKTQPAFENWSKDNPVERAR